MITVSDVRPNAVAIIEPVGPSSDGPRQHSLTVTLSLSGIEPRFADKDVATEVVRRAFDVFAPVDGAQDRRAFVDVSLSTRARGKEGKVTSAVVSVEATVMLAERPTAEAIEQVRKALAGAGYRVSLRERRECSEKTCHSEVVLTWNATGSPPGWFSQVICGKHDYRCCTKCKSIYLLHAESAAGQAPALACEVCGTTMIAWGGSKVWTAELIARADTAAVAAP
jgi:hypothetical protein